MLLQLDNPEEAAKVKIPTGKKVEQLNGWISGGASLRSTATTSKGMTFVKALELAPQNIGLRSLSKLKSAHGRLYMEIHYNQSHFYLVLGTKDKPVTTPKGITVNDDPKGAWAFITIACEGEVQQSVEAIDGRMRELLADNSQVLFGMKCTPELIAKYKFYTTHLTTDFCV